jgi:hypothetical protein
VYAGGQGATITAAQQCGMGRGWNGGGACGCSDISSTGYGGGGASDVRRGNFGLADRIIMLSEGRIGGVFAAGAATQTDLLRGAMAKKGAANAAEPNG